VPQLRTINRFLSRHRRAVALVGVLMVVGVVALNAHAALPEHHDDHGEGATMCVAALSIAVLAALGWRAKRVDGPVARLVQTPLVRITGRFPVEPPETAARAGPMWTAVLRR
jgi:peptidoglycan/LPS O-acetylase OafA/YrhL